MKELMAKKRCKCKMCTRHRMIREATDRANVHTLKRIIDDLENSLVETEEELSYYSSIFNGTWPGAVWKYMLPTPVPVETPVDK